jgi:sugar-specific transcriptional regulator TrmB
MDDSDLADCLEQFGLSGKEVDTYLALLELGEAKATAVADAAGVSKRYVYSVSEELEARGFVEVNDHVVPTTIRARPPEEVVAALSRDVEAIGPALAERYSRSAPTEEGFEVVKSRPTVRKRLSTLVEGAGSELAVALPESSLAGLRSELAAAVDRGVLVLVLVTGVEGAVATSFVDVASAVRAWRAPMPVLATADGRTGVLAAREVVTRSDADSRALVFTQEQVAPVLVGSFLGNYWPVAEEVHVADPAPLPATYTAFRQAVLHAALHRRAGREVRAVAEGRSVHDGGADRTSLAGRVVDVRQGLAEPVTNSFPVEASLVVESPEATVSVGGPGAFVEEFEADRVTLERAD